MQTIRLLVDFDCIKPNLACRRNLIFLLTYNKGERREQDRLLDGKESGRHGGETLVGEDPGRRRGKGGETS